jgi:hypothetical protein
VRHPKKGYPKVAEPGILHPISSSEDSFLRRSWASKDFSRRHGFLH